MLQSAGESSWQADRCALSGHDSLVLFHILDDISARNVRTIDPQILTFKLEHTISPCEQDLSTYFSVHLMPTTKYYYT